MIWVMNVILGERLRNLRNAAGYTLKAILGYDFDPTGQGTASRKLYRLPKSGGLAKRPRLKDLQREVQIHTPAHNLST